MKTHRNKKKGGTKKKWSNKKRAIVGIGVVLGSYGVYKIINVVNKFIKQFTKNFEEQLKTYTDLKYNTTTLVKKIKTATNKTKTEIFKLYFNGVKNNNFDELAECIIGLMLIRKKKIKDEYKKYDESEDKNIKQLSKIIKDIWFYNQIIYDNIRNEL